MRWKQIYFLTNSLSIIKNSTHEIILCPLPSKSKRNWYSMLKPKTMCNESLIAINVMQCWNCFDESTKFNIYPDFF